MAKETKSSIKKKVELLKRTQQIDSMLDAGNIRNQALLDSTGEMKIVDEVHALDLLSEEPRHSSAVEKQISNKGVEAHKKAGMHKKGRRRSTNP